MAGRGEERCGAAAYRTCVCRNDVARPIPGLEERTGWRRSGARQPTAHRRDRSAVRQERRFHRYPVMRGWPTSRAPASRPLEDVAELVRVGWGVPSPPAWRRYRVRAYSRAPGVPSGGSFWQSHSAAASAKAGSFGARSAAGNGGVLSSMVRRNDDQVGDRGRIAVEDVRHAAGAGAPVRLHRRQEVRIGADAERLLERLALRRGGSTARCRRCRAASAC